MIDKKVRKVDVHDCIPRILEVSGNLELASLVDPMLELRKRRNNADYEIAIPKHGEQEEAKTWSAVGKEVEATINRVRANATLNDRRAIQQTIKPHLGQAGILYNWHVTANL
jgi:hypothetical protein